MTGTLVEYLDLSSDGKTEYRYITQVIQTVCDLAIWRLFLSPKHQVQPKRSRTYQHITEDNSDQQSQNLVVTNYNSSIDQLIWL